MEREEIIEILVIFEGKADSYYRGMNEDQLQAYYAEYLKKGEEV